MAATSRAVLWCLVAGCGWSDSVVPAARPAAPEALRCEGEDRKGYECFVPVTGAVFWMGAQATDPSGPGFDPAASPNEGPPHKVAVGDFWIMQHEVPTTAYLRCVEQGACDPRHVEGGGFNVLPTEGAAVRSLQPVNGIDWAGAQEFCTWRGGRLPTEAEWALAARGPEGRRFPWGEEPACGVQDDRVDEQGRSLEHGTIRKGPCQLSGPGMPDTLAGESPFGVVGMAGNLWEWTADDYAPYPGGPSLQAAPEGRVLKVQRGGGWTSEDPLELRSAVRLPMDASARLNDVGFRCVWGPA